MTIKEKVDALYPYVSQQMHEAQPSRAEITAMLVSALAEETFACLKIAKQIGDNSITADGKFVASKIIEAIAF